MRALLHSPRPGRFTCDLVVDRQLPLTTYTNRRACMAVIPKARPCMMWMSASSELRTPPIPIFAARVATRYASSSEGPCQFVNGGVTDSCRPHALYERKWL